LRAVLDVNVLVSGLLSRTGAPGRLLAFWLGGAFELVISESLLVELARALAYPKIREHISREEAVEFIELLRSTALMHIDAELPDRVSRDSGDDYLVALATASASILVSGDRDLLALTGKLPIHAPSQFLDRLER
jgi:putative PIN family toxin of toxin-antitoxin system